MANVPETPLPTLERLGVSSLPANLDAKKVAQDWLSSFLQAAIAGNVDAVVSLLLPDAFWRDMLALTWDMRTFSGKERIAQFLKDRLSLSKIHDIKLREQFVALQQPYPDLAWISLMFDFATDVGQASGIARLVPSAAGEWKAHVVFTNLESLTDFPEKTGPLRNMEPNHGKWQAQRQREIDFTDQDPVVLVIGGGQSGLEIAARLKYLDIPSLVVERNPRIGDNWRNRYEALCLHDPIWYDHMPYIPFPSTWPVYTPAQKLANWLESYAESLELNVWTSSTISDVRQDPATLKWHVSVKRGDGTDRKFEVNHVVFSTGLGSGVGNIPKYPDMDKFKGQILHSSQHKRALDHKGKKVVVVGACTSAHDISQDYQQHGVDVTMFQRGSTYIMSTKNGWEVIMKGGYWEGGPPADIVDRVNASFPHHMSTVLNQRQTKRIAELDKDLLDSLHKVGFRTNLGIKDTGFGLLAWSKAGGYYLDTGASKLIAEGKIKLKTDSTISSFTETSIKFENGSELPADVVVFSTGVGTPIDHIRQVCGEEVANKCRPIWGLNDEGEINGAWRNLGVVNLWYMMEIKAIEEGLLTSRYELQTTKV
ncbi:Indole-3-pyruvate monooxygenase YUCCA1 [Psilocybe cubensis]|uniref:FAD/NAD(P)-binding domain-containing protein n=2 Tax=Psilocybe cubensis TaxID=181762 RepID=A0A8H7Y4A3_PSICU|nr:Indole-3-pyruvate monooxygenase YUCCA1 [Psilocybe cubensis]KAH9484751.1 Indole-3-pyruvate monooxygenase YUCCA1 [Psilocybe cubensis]